MNDETSPLLLYQESSDWKINIDEITIGKCIGKGSKKFFFIYYLFNFVQFFQKEFGR